MTSNSGAFRVVDFEALPSLDERLRALAVEGHERNPLWVKDALTFDRVARVACQLIAVGSISALELPSVTSYDSFITKGGVSRLRQLFRPETEAPTEVRVVWIPVAEIHHPAGKGCAAWLERGKATEWQYSAKVKLFGFGGGGDAKTGIELTRRVTIDAPPCVRVTIPVEARCSIPEPGSSQRPRIDILRVIEGPFGTLPLQLDSDRCSLSPDQAGARGWATLPIPLQAGVGKEDFSRKAGRECGFNGTAGVTLGVFEASLGAEVTWKESTMWGYTLVLGRNYLACSPNYAAGYVWPVHPAAAGQPEAP